MIKLSKKIKELIKPVLGRGNDSPNSPDKAYLKLKKQQLPPVSICIPAYEMYGKGDMHLKRSLDILARQTYKNFEVVVSDHSISDLIENCCLAYKDVLNLKYIRNEKDRGTSSGNLNVALDHASHEIIRIIFQDDSLSDEGALERAVKYFVYSGAKWMANGCNHREISTGRIYHNHYPVFVQGALYTGVNSLGCPSVITLCKNSIRLDVHLPALMDLDFYEQLYSLYGEPVIFNDINTTIGVHPGMVTNNGGSGKAQLDKEIAYLRKKFQSPV